jgi:hypothetical protein
MSLITYIHEETAYLSLKEEEIGCTNPLLSAQIGHYTWEHGRCNDLHMLRLKRLEKMKGPTGSLVPGKGVLFSETQGSFLSTHSGEINDHAIDEDAPPAEDNSDNDKADLLVEMAMVIQVSED